MFDYNFNSYLMGILALNKMDLIGLIEEQEIIEKQTKMLSEPNEDRFSFSQVRARAAKRDADIDNLLKRGTSPDDVYYILEPLGVVRPCHIQARVAKLERETDSNDIDIITGEAFATGGYVGINQP
jgi:hypothetical protein